MTEGPATNGHTSTIYSKPELRVERKMGVVGINILVCGGVEGVRFEGTH